MVELNDQQGAMEKRSDEGFEKQYMATENLRGVSKAGRTIFIVASVWTEARMGDQECIIYIRRQEAAIGETIAFGQNQTKSASCMLCLLQVLRRVAKLNAY